MISALPMYEIHRAQDNLLPKELEHASDEWYRAILRCFLSRDGNADDCADDNDYNDDKNDTESLRQPPRRLSRDEDKLASLSDWGAQGKVFLAQTCGFPAMIYSDSFKMIAIPKYIVQGCQGCDQRSAIVTFRGSSIASLAHLFREDIRLTLAISSRVSTSGCLVLAATLGSEVIRRMADRMVYTGSHLRSILSIIQKRADIAAIDCVSLATIQANYPGTPHELRPCCCPSLLLHILCRDFPGSESHWLHGVRPLRPIRD